MAFLRSVGADTGRPSEGDPAHDRLSQAEAARRYVLFLTVLGKREWVVIDHTRCEMELFDGETMGALLDDSRQTVAVDGTAWSNPHHGGGSSEEHLVHWHTIENQEESVDDDVRRIRGHALVPMDVPIYGLAYDVKTGRLLPVAAANEAGRPARPAPTGSTAGQRDGVEAAFAALDQQHTLSSFTAPFRCLQRRRSAFDRQAGTVPITVAELYHLLGMLIRLRPIVAPRAGRNHDVVQWFSGSDSEAACIRKQN